MRKHRVRRKIHASLYDFLIKCGTTGTSQWEISQRLMQHVPIHVIKSQLEYWRGKGAVQRFIVGKNQKRTIHWRATKKLLNRGMKMNVLEYDVIIKKEDADHYWVIHETGAEPVKVSKEHSHVKYYYDPEQYDILIISEWYAKKVGMITKYFKRLAREH